MTEIDGLPDLSFLHEVLAPWRGRSAAVVRMEDDSGRAFGNNGDHLMLAVFWKVLENAGVQLLEPGSEHSAQVIIVPPNGALLQIYNFPSLLRSRLAELPDVPILMFPSSALFPSWNPAQLFGARTGPIEWILRERASFEHLSSLWGSELRSAGVTLSLDHDIVASGNALVPGIIGARTSPRGVLVAAREDREAGALGQSNSSRSPSLKGRALSLALARLPANAARSRLVRLATIRRRHAAADALVARAVAAGALPTLFEGSPRTNIDLSSTTYATFRQYCAAITAAQTVVTNRLHVALPAAISGADVYLVDSGYHKLRGVYERSLSQMSNVTLLTSP